MDTLTAPAGLAAPPQAVTADIARQFRALADLLEDRNLPVAQFCTTYSPWFAASTGEVDEIAALLGVTAKWTSRGHYVAEFPVGPNVAYKAMYLTDQAKSEGRHRVTGVAA